MLLGSIHMVQYIPCPKKLSDGTICVLRGINLTISGVSWDWREQQWLILVPLSCLPFSCIMDCAKASTCTDRLLWIVGYNDILPAWQK